MKKVTKICLLIVILALILCACVPAEPEPTWPEGLEGILFTEGYSRQNQNPASPEPIPDYVETIEKTVGEEVEVTLNGTQIKAYYVKTVTELGYIKQHQYVVGKLPSEIKSYEHDYDCLWFRDDGSICGFDLFDYSTTDGVCIFTLEDSETSEEARTLATEALRTAGIMDLSQYDGCDAYTYSEERNAHRFKFFNTAGDNRTGTVAYLQVDENRIIRAYIKDPFKPEFDWRTELEKIPAVYPQELLDTVATALYEWGDQKLYSLEKSVPEYVMQYEGKLYICYSLYYKIYEYGFLDIIKILVPIERLNEYIE